jgi:putative transposase
MSYTQIYLHLVFATKDRVPLIAHAWEDEMYRYLSGIIGELKGQPIEINGMPEHVHVFGRFSPLLGISDLVRVLKANSSKWARRTHQPKFGWQRRYGAFSVSESLASTVREYVRRQKLHHQRQSFEEEYRELLRLHRIDFQDQYMWD